MRLLVQESFIQGVLVDVILDFIVLKHLICGRLKVICQWLKRTLEVIAVRYLNPVFLIELIMCLEDVAQILEVILHGVIRVPRLKNDPALLSEEGLDCVLMLLVQHWEALGVLKEDLGSELQ